MYYLIIDYINGVTTVECFDSEFKADKKLNNILGKYFSYVLKYKIKYSKQYIAV